jgi:signal transduction histidine kinase
MRERVALFGGELRAGPRSDGGFEVRARIPFDGTRAPLPATTQHEAEAGLAASRDQLRWPWLDPLLSAVALVALELAVLNVHPRRGPLALSVIVVGGIPLVTIWRRRFPVYFAVAVLTLDWVTQTMFGLPKHGLITVFIWAFVLYTLAAWTGRRTAVVGLAGIVGLFTLEQMLGRTDANAVLYTGLVLLLATTWGCGRAIRSRRRMTRELERLSEQLAVEHEHRARLAVAGERSRIARELDAAIARSVAAMVVQSEAAATLLDHDHQRSDAVMEAIEHTGRQALAELRLTLGVLRKSDESNERKPQPSVDRIYTLIQRTRELGQPVELHVDGEPGTLPHGVELALYRIVEDALTTVRRQPDSSVDVAVSFREDDVELCMRAGVDPSSAWPTHAMRERAALCDGELDAIQDSEGRCELVARLPRALQGAIA